MTRALCIQPVLTIYSVCVIPMTASHATRVVCRVNGKKERLLLIINGSGALPFVLTSGSSLHGSIPTTYMYCSSLYTRIIPAVGKQVVVITVSCGRLHDTLEMHVFLMKNVNVNPLGALVIVRL